MLRLAAFALAFAFVPASARAHPHVWIDMRSSVHFTDNGLADAIDMSWTFDAAYSQFATEDIDANNNKQFDAVELQRVADAYARNLRDLDNFTFVEAAGKPADTTALTNAKATFDKNRLTIAFRLPLAKPVDPAAVKLRYASFDPTYYVDIAPAGADVALTGGAPKNCSAALRKVDATKAGALGLARAVKMIAPTADVLNATNAVIVDVTCAIVKPAAG
jgi:ABC-type uncharacterized transport system substrate-binding protein